MMDMLRRKGLGGRVGMLRGKGPLKVVLPRVKFNTSLCSKRDFLIKFHTSSLRLVMKRWKNLEFKKGTFGTHLMRSLHVSSVEMIISVNDWLEQGIVCVVERVSTR